MKYRVLPDAQADLEEIDDWVLENFGPAFADQTQGKLYGTFEILTNFPHHGPNATRCYEPSRAFLFT